MLAELTSAQFAEWMAYSRLEPWGEERDDLRMGIIASTIANANRSKGQKPFTPQQFMPDFERVSEDEQMRRMVEQLRKSLGGKR